jgi:hypothetical protein
VETNLICTIPNVQNMVIFYDAYIIYIGIGVVLLILTYLNCTFQMGIHVGSDNCLVNPPPAIRKIPEIVCSVNN